MQSNLVQVGQWVYFRGWKFWHADVGQIADMRRSANSRVRLAGAALEEFVMACLAADIENGATLGFRMTPQDFALYHRKMAAQTALAA